MRTVITILLVILACAACATFRDPRDPSTLKRTAPLTQEEVERQLALQKQIGQVGGVPQRTDITGYTQSHDDPGAAAVLAGKSKVDSSSEVGRDALITNNEEMKGETTKTSRTAFGGLWALLAGLVIAGGGWAGMQKFGPRPPAHMLR